MKLKQTIQIVLSMLLVAASTTSFAGRQGINFLYGIGGGGIYADSSNPAIDYDVAPSGNIFIGFEEDGWAIEYASFKSIESGTSVAGLDYSVSGTQTSLAYRTVESGRTYFKIKYGNADLDYSYSNNLEALTDGKIYGVGMGWRLKRDERLELDYGFYSGSQGADDVHMLMVNYMFGGNLGKSGL
ncbi:MAG: hypothetical protein OQK76_08870 [Gammaproteobacteria bacterium]|nr:hypothetical protein [Gammaproteobacteria bacterium]MCW8910713.1 hypothetical protein [Gammaproteobacteria bacterium]MCW9006166.1 hypothetical protein [Gammaproteobacteria bacterium]MCW9056266.1 hypothetical protein [Gammaproteobacteria bacterium]